MSNPKPPTARWEMCGASMDYTEGYRVSPWVDLGTIRVDFMTGDPDVREMALAKMGGVLSRKGWTVRAGSNSRFLIVKAMEG